MPVFLRGRRAFCIIPAPPTSPMQPLISPPRHRFGPRLPAPRLFVLHLLVPRQPRCCRSLPLLLSPRLLRCCCRLPLLSSLCLLRCRRPRIPKRRTDRPSPAWSEMPPRTASLLQFCPEHRHGPRPFSCSTRRRTADPRPCSARGTKKADGTAQRSVRRQKATNLSRQHHRGSSSTRQVSARA